MAFVTINGVRLHYRDQGEGPAVILVHGWTLDLDMWAPQAVVLSDEFRIVRFDRRGYGLSEGLPSPEKDPKDIAALCDQLGMGRVALVGMSQGARAVVRFVSENPSRVSAVILDGPPALEGSAVDSDVPMAQFRDVAQGLGMDAFRKEWARHPLTQLRNQNPLMQMLVARMIQRYPGHDLLARDASESNAVALKLDSIVAPTLVLSGEHDLASRVQAAKNLAAELPSAEYAVIADAGHLANLDQPGRYNDVCRTFLMRHIKAHA